MRMYKAVYADVQCPSVTCETTELTITGLDCSLGTLVYGHQTWNMYL